MLDREARNGRTLDYYEIFISSVISTQCYLPALILLIMYNLEVLGLGVLRSILSSLRHRVEPRFRYHAEDDQRSDR